MYYIDLTIQFITKMTMQVIPFVAVLIILTATTTAFTKDTRWLRKAIDKIYIKML